jgi:superfamily I DNA and RNA helicase
LTAELSGLRCQVIDFEDAKTSSHREAVLIIAQTFDYPGAVVLCEPSVVGARSGAPDIVAVEPKAGVHVFEVKGVTLDQVSAVKAGGAIEIHYDGTVSRKDPSRQARQAMFDIKDSASRRFNGELHIPFQSWVIFTRIKRGDWEYKFGDAIPSRSDVLFQDEIESSRLREILQKEGINRLSYFQLSECPQLQIKSVMAAFGDSEVLASPPRNGPTPPEGTKGRVLSDDLGETKTLTELQQKIAARIWDDGPRLVRGVAGSGKTIVLATQAARLIERRQKQSADLFAEKPDQRPVLAVCFNRTLVPFIRHKIRTAYLQRTGDELPDKSLSVMHLNSLLYDLHRKGFCKYRRVGDVKDASERASLCLSDFAALNGEFARQLNEGLFHSIYIDEGQDFQESEYKLLMRLCSRTTTGQPRIFVFYDDAQNLYGCKRPVWSDLGLDLRGRSVVMDECFRNTREIIEPAFNVLVGTHAKNPQSVPSRGFADTQTLIEKGLISYKRQHIHVKFASRIGDKTNLRTHTSKRDEEIWISNLCNRLITEEGLLPQDLLILTFRKERALEVAKRLEEKIGSNKVARPFEDSQKDDLAIQADRISVSTVASAKGYDAPFVIVASLESFPDNVEGRASLYVACTRAREWLQLSSSGTSALFHEFQSAIDATAYAEKTGTGIDAETIVAELLSRSRSWNDLQQGLAKHDLEYYERGGGLALRNISSGSHVCKASDVGPGYGALIAKFKAPFPGHSHQWLAENVLGVITDQEK